MILGCFNLICGRQTSLYSFCKWKQANLISYGSKSTPGCWVKLSVGQFLCSLVLFWLFFPLLISSQLILLVPPPPPSSHQPNTCYTFPLRPCTRCRCLEKSVWLTSTKVGRCLEGYQDVMRAWDHRIWTGIRPPTDWGECEETQELLLSMFPPAGLRIIIRLLLSRHEPLSLFCLLCLQVVVLLTLFITT